MNYQPKHQTTLRNLSQPMSQRQRLNYIVLILGCLLLLNTAFFASIAHATPTPVPPIAPSPTTPEVTDTPTPAVAPTAPVRASFTGLYGLGLAAFTFGGLLLISTVLFVRMPVANPRHRDEHDE